MTRADWIRGITLQLYTKPYLYNHHNNKIKSSNSMQFYTQKLVTVFSYSTSHMEKKKLVYQIFTNICPQWHYYPHQIKTLTNAAA